MTGIVILATIGLLLAYDVVVMYRLGEKQSISSVITEASLKRPIIPFLFGLVMGHWFWG
jgi:hypothetical protein